MAHARPASRHKMPDKAECEVSNCVSNLINAFDDGLNIYNRFRERWRRRRSRKHGSSSQDSEKASEAEMQLSNSLKRGPTEIRYTYERNYGKAGERFAKGDSIAHASLAEVLIRLNTGLVNIIAAFLSHDSKSKRLDLDYRSLVSLSEASRIEAVESLDRLCSRLSQSQLHMSRIAGCPQCGSQKHSSCSSTSKTQQDSRPRSRARSSQLSSGPTMARVEIKESGSGQYAVVRRRPKDGRKKTSSTATSSSGASKSAASSPLSSTYTSPPGSPLPLYAAKDPYPSQREIPSTNRRRANSIDGPRPTTPYARPEEISRPQTTAPPAAHPSSKRPHHRSRGGSVSKDEKISRPSDASVSRRRLEKITPSTYTFASDSTKLGEIPQRNWAEPWNYEEAARLNAEVAAMGYPEPAMAASSGKTKKKGLFGFLRKGSGVAV